MIAIVEDDDLMRATLLGLMKGAGSRPAGRVQGSRYQRATSRDDVHDHRPKDDVTRRTSSGCGLTQAAPTLR